MRATAHRQLTMFDRTRDVMDVITMTVCDHFGTDIRVVRSSSRRQPFARVRMIVMFVTRQLTELTHREIGSVIGRNASTVVTGVQEIEAALEFDPFLRRSIDSCSMKTRAALEQLAAIV